MNLWPNPRSWLNEVVITPWSRCALNLVLPSDGPSSAAWPAANRALYIPFRLAEPLLVTQMFVANGTANSGHFDVGIYSADGTRLVSSGSTSAAGTTTIQAVDTTDTLIGPGNYYMAMASDTGAGATYWNLQGVTDRNMRGLGCFQQASAFALPATATFALVASAYIPLFGLTGRAVI